MSNRLFSLTASYTFSGMKASFLDSLPLPFGGAVPFGTATSRSDLGVDVPDAEGGDGVNSSKKKILLVVSGVSHRTLGART